MMMILMAAVADKNTSARQRDHYYDHDHDHPARAAPLMGSWLYGGHGRGGVADAVPAPAVMMNKRSNSQWHYGKEYNDIHRDVNMDMQRRVIAKMGSLLGRRHVCPVAPSIVGPMFMATGFEMS